MNGEAYSVTITSDTRKTNHWLSGYIGDDVRFHAKVYDGGSIYGIDGGRVSKLEIRENDEIIVNYDRGWDVVPIGNEYHEIFKAVMAKLNSLETEHSLDNSGMSVDKRSVLDRLDASKQAVAENDMMQMFEVEITETLQKTVYIRAKNAEDAESEVRDAYHNEDYILDSDNLMGVDFTVTPASTREHDKRRSGDAL